jgi:plasmid stabilization system protein ParE
MEVIWTETAEKSYYKILEYLKENWHSKVINDFIDRVENTMSIIQNNPNCFEEYTINKKYIKGFIHENVSFYYRIYDNEIVVHLFWNNYQNPQKLKNIL